MNGLRLLWLGGFLLACLVASPARAQTVEGRVLEAETGEPIAGATLILRDEGGSARDQTESAEDGSFLLAARRPGVHTLEVEQLGYLAPSPEPFELAEELVEVEVRLARSPIALEPLTVVGRRRDARHDATFEGALARHRIFPRMGTRRVVLRSDPEFRSSIVVSDILRWFHGRRGCTIVFSDGFLARSPEAVTMWLNEVSTENLEAVEFYRFWNDAPPDLKDVPPYVFSPQGCSVVALWPRVDPPDRPAWTFRRILYVVGGVGGLFLLTAVVGSAL